MTSRTSSVLALVLLLIALLACAGAVELPAKGPMPAGATWSGKYSSNYGWILLEQDGARVTGKYEYENGELQGTTDGNRLSFSWRQTNGDVGRAVFVMAAGGRHFDGSWGMGEDENGSGEWSGDKTADLPAKAHPAAAASSAASSPVAGSLPDGPRISSEVEAAKALAEPSWPAGTRRCKKDVADCKAQCDSGNGTSCDLLGLLLVDGAKGSDAVVAFDRGCGLGALVACQNLGVALTTGNGGAARDEARANAAFTKGCEGGLGDSCMSLALSYQKGRGVAADPARAVTLLQRGCEELRDGECCFNLGIATEAGNGVARDARRALDWFALACQRRDPLGCVNVGVAYLKAEVIKKDEAEATRLFDLGCSRGEAKGCTNLGLAYLDGWGVAVDPARGKQLVAKGCQMGDDNACRIAQRDGIPVPHRGEIPDVGGGGR